MVFESQVRKRPDEPDANGRKKQGDQIQAVQRQNSRGQDFHLA